jgi:hypothetical protein
MLVILYADDTVLFADSAVEMQIQLDNFSEYCSIYSFVGFIDVTLFSIQITPSS